jgi:drug/metabolite transporter (DMT)-like permease
MHRFLRLTDHPEIVVAVSAAIWGLFWIPLRAFESFGLEPAWVTASQFIVPLLLMLPFAARRIIKNQPAGFGQYKTGILIGVAFVLYCESLLLTDVVRSMILFYVMPAWGTLAEVGLMGRRFTIWRGLALILSLSGLMAILGIGGEFSLSLNLGDFMALVSGIVFTLGAMRVRNSRKVSVFEQVFAFFLFGSVFALALSFLPLTALGTAPTPDLLIQLIPWFILMSLGFLIPIMWGLYWSSQFVDPGRLGILLQLEAVIGIGSAAILTGEPFGWREAAGAILVLSAGIVEVFGNRAPNTGENISAPK